MVYRSYEFCRGGEGDEVVAFGGVVVVCHCVCEAADDGFCYVCESRGLLANPLFKEGIALSGGNWEVNYLCSWAACLVRSA